jgi:hypothetical protein
VRFYEATGNKDNAKEWQEKLTETKAKAMPAARP